jgi:hypothetical protein
MLTFERRKGFFLNRGRSLRVVRGWRGGAAMPDKLRCEGCGGFFTRLGKHLTLSEKCYAAAVGSAAKQAEEPSASTIDSVLDNDVSLVLYKSHRAVAVVDDLSSMHAI